MSFFFKRGLYLIFAMFVCFCEVNAAIFISLKSSEVNLRVGPGKEYPIAWIFMKSNLPMMLVAEFDQWRKIKFIDDTEGWVHKNMISMKNTAIVTTDVAIIYRNLSESHPIAKMEKGVVMRVLKKEGKWLKVEINNFKGWIMLRDVWGVSDAD